jgi:hypothetical protein
MFKKIPYRITGMTGLGYIDKMGQIQFILEINHNLKMKLNFLAG